MNNKGENGMPKMALIGIEGFGRVHVRQIVGLAREGMLECVAFADPKPDLQGDSYAALTSLGAVHYNEDTVMLQSRDDIDFVVIATPIPLHAPMAIRAMQAGVNVLVEKPPAVTVQDLDAIAAVRDATGKLCAVQFQNISGQAFQRAAGLLRSGVVGAVKRVTGVGMWKRTDRYYSRTPWAGKLSSNGRLILDGTLINPFAHLLQNCLLLAGAAGGSDTAAEPVAIQAELYHANPIEGEDTACLRAETRNGVDVNLYTTLCHSGSDTPYIEVVGDGGSLRWSYDNSLHLRSADGETENLRFPEEDMIRNMYLNLIDSLSGRSALHCPIERSRSFLLTVNGAFESSGAVHPIPEEHLERVTANNETATLVPGVPQLIREASDRGALFSELGVPWAVRTRRISLEGYREFRWDGVSSRG